MLLKFRFKRILFIVFGFRERDQSNHFSFLNLEQIFGSYNPSK